ncbi:hypothetical protein LCGC14_2765140 [marine sediment metagenome]|uniref:Uncharacterized protein n=1 Tax=marine sediment metagenome TaxID=412755 RepID=A0A0F9BPD6_9ZZZZ
MDHDWKFIGWIPSSVSSEPSASSPIGKSLFQCVHCGTEKSVGRTNKNHRTPPTPEELRLRRDPNADLFNVPPEPTCDEEAVRDVMES